MTSRERVLAALHCEEADRVPIHDSPWVSTIERWHKEGLRTDLSPAEFFDYEIVNFGADTSPQFPIEVVEETEEYIINTTSFGGLRRDHKNYSSTPEIMDYPCKSREDWEKIKERLTPSRDRVDWEGKWLVGTAEDERGEESALETGRVEWRRGLPGCKRAREQGKFTCYSAGVGYDRIQSYVASERLLIAIATEPDWVRDMYETDANLAIKMHKIMKEGGFEFDGAWLFCDLGYRNALLFSPRHFEEQLRPTFQRLFDYFGSQGMPTILHSCGCVRELIPYFIEDGLTCLQPLEVKAGMDLIELKKNFGDKMAFMGGIDVRAMAHPDPSVIEEEIKRKIPFAKKGGGYINPEKKHPSMFEPIHGSAPKYTGKEIVNPVASIESVRMMLEHLGEAEAARKILDAVIHTLASGTVRTADMGGNHKTYEMGDEIRKAMLA